MVKVRVNGRLEVTACVISDEMMNLNDREMLEDLIRDATNQAIAKVRQQIADETTKWRGTSVCRRAWAYPVCRG